MCGEPSPSGRIAWETACAQRALRDFRATERALGAILTSGDRRVARSGSSPPLTVPVSTPLARLTERNGRPTYLIRAESRSAEIRLEFTLDQVASMLETPAGLGASGDMFLRDASGTFLTPPRFGGAAVPVAFTEWSHGCGLDPSEWVDIDYRGIETVHGLRAVPGFAEPVCVDTHFSHAEALAPADALLADLGTRALQLAVVGIVLALVAAHWMSAPVQRLAAAVRAVERGEFATPMHPRGPTEIRQLATAFGGMARALGEQMAREQRARRDAETANRAKDDFLAVLSHELRTPLTSTLGWTRLLRRGGLDGPHADRAITAIERSAKTQKRLIEDLLDVSRIIAGRLQLDRAEIRLADPVRHAVDELRPMAQERDVEVETLVESSPTLAADALRVEQIVTNLLSNAIKFTPAKGRVTVRVREEGPWAEVVVSDTGVGIAREFLPHVFEPFQQGDAGPRRAFGGLGLGLSIVQHLVRLHGGTITASSPGRGAGATFLVRLPLKPSAMQPTAAGTAAASSAKNPQHRLDNLRVLVVEDDEETRQIVTALIEDAGAKVDGVASAAEGRERLTAYQYSVIVSDLAMPHEDGFSFMRAVRTANATVPALALTALARREDAAAAYAAGFQVCLTKPVDRDRLIGAIAELAVPQSA